MDAELEQETRFLLVLQNGFGVSFSCMKYVHDFKLENKPSFVPMTGAA